MALARLALTTACRAEHVIMRNGSGALAAAATQQQVLEGPVELHPPPATAGLALPATAGLAFVATTHVLTRGIGRTRAAIGMGVHGQHAGTGTWNVHGGCVGAA